MRIYGLIFWSFFFLAVTPALGLSLAEEAQKTAASSPIDFANGLYSRKMYGPAISEYQKFISASPDSTDVASAYFRLADSYYFLKDYPRAIEQFSAYRQKFPADPRNFAALLRIGTAQYYQKNYDVAEKSFLLIGASGAEDALKSGALFYLAKTSQARGNLSKALGLLRVLSARYPDSEYTIYACLTAGDIFTARKKEAEAVRAYGIVAQKQAPASAVEEAILKIADLYFAAKKYTDSRYYYQKAYNRPDKASTERILSGIFYTDYYLKDLESAKKLYGENEAFLQKSAMGSDVEYLLALLGYEKNDFVLSLGYLERVLANPAAGEAVKKKALAAKGFVEAENLRGKGDLEKALAGYVEVLKSPDSPYFRAALYQAGFLSVELKKSSDAREFFSKYIQKYSEGDEVERAALEKIQIDLNDENFPSAVQSAEDFAVNYPKSRFQDLAMYKLGMGFAGEKDYAGASRTFEKLIANFPSSEFYADALYGAAAGYDSAGNFSSAIVYYEQFAAGYPSHGLYADVLQRLGYLYVQSGDLRKAADFYEDIIVHKPQIPLESSVALWTLRYDLDNSRYENMKPILALLPGRYPDQQLAHEINFFLGESLMGSKNYEEAQKYYSRAVSIRLDGAYTAHAYLGLGIIAAVASQWDEAEKYFTQALGYPNEIDVALRARFEIANLNLCRSRLEDAAKAFMHVAILYDDEKYCSASLFKAGECFDKLGRPEESRQAFEELLKRYPQSEWSPRAEIFLKKDTDNHG